MKKLQSSKNKSFIFFDIDDTLFDTDTFIQSKFKKFFLYPDVEEGLSTLSEMATLGIFSKGDREFQHMKLDQTGIKKFFSPENIFVVDDKIAVINDTLKEYNKKGKVFFVEDRLPLLHDLKKEFPELFAIWIKRGRYAVHQQKTKEFFIDKEVNTLHDIIPFLQ